MNNDVDGVWGGFAGTPNAQAVPPPVRAVSAAARGGDTSNTGCRPGSVRPDR